MTVGHMGLILGKRKNIFLALNTVYRLMAIKFTFSEIPGKQRQNEERRTSIKKSMRAQGNFLIIWTCKKMHKCCREASCSRERL